MNAIATSDSPSPKKYRPLLRIAYEILIVLSFTLLFFGSLILLVKYPECVEQFFLGWLYFPLSVIPKMTLDWSAIALGSASFVAFFIMLARFLRWFLTQKSEVPELASQQQLTQRSPRRLALLGTVGVLLLFAAGIAMVGVTHQFVWLLSRKPYQSAEHAVSSEVPFGMIAHSKMEESHQAHKYNLKYIGIACQNFNESWSSLPPGGMINHRGEPLHGWIAFLGVWLNYNTNNLDYSIPWNAPPNDESYRCAIQELINPAIQDRFDENGFGYSHYAGNVHVLPIRQLTAEESQNVSRGWGAGLGDAKNPNRLVKTFKDIKDGLGQTILAGEVSSRFKPWGHPLNVRDPALGFGQSSDGFAGVAGANSTLMVMCDGSVRAVNNKTDPKIAAALGTPAGGETVPIDLD